MDLLERLRQKATLGYSSICLEAADEIERLQGIIDAAMGGKKPFEDRIQLAVENRQLRAERDEWKKRCMDLIHRNIEKPEIINGPTGSE